MTTLYCMLELVYWALVSSCCVRKWSIYYEESASIQWLLLSSCKHDLFRPPCKGNVLFACHFTTSIQVRHFCLHHDLPSSTFPVSHSRLPLRCLGCVTVCTTVPVSALLERQSIATAVNCNNLAWLAQCSSSVQLVFTAVTLLKARPIHCFTEQSGTNLARHFPVWFQENPY